MEMTGERLIPAPRQRVWEALNDPAILKASIPGCESLERVAEHELRATAAVKIGPIAARFAGKVTLSDLDPPNGYTISGEGQGGVAGFAKGGATVRLADAAEGATRMAYDVKAQVGGKMAQLGARLIDATAKQMADAFFERFAAQLAPAAPAAALAATDGAEVAAAPLPQPPPAAPPSPISLIPAAPLGLPLVTWVGFVIFFAILVLVGGAFLS